MKLGIFTFLFNDRSLEDVARYASQLGYEMVELPVWRGSNHLNMDEVLKGDHPVEKKLRKYGLAISALNNSLEGQLVLGPLDEATDEWAPSKDPEEKVKYGMERMKRTAQVASELQVPVVNGFVGSSVWDKWYIFPPENEKLYERGWQLFANRWGEIMDTFRKYGVKFALEVYPTEIAYNIETAGGLSRSLMEEGSSDSTSIPVTLCGSSLTR